MEINSIDDSLASKVIDKATLKFNQVFLELGLREDNLFCGSGSGGNNEQLYFLLGITHFLNKGTDISIINDGVAWDAQWLADADVKSIRRKLDEKYLEIKKVYESSFIFSKTLKTGSNLFQNQLVYACDIASSLSKDLDNNITTNIKTVAEIFKTFLLEITLIAVRKFIGLERLVKFNLDEDPNFGPLLLNVANKVCR